jgi:hypothetical protein
MVGNTIMVLHRAPALIGGLTVDGFVLDAKLQCRTLFYLAFVGLQHTFAC